MERIRTFTVLLPPAPQAGASASSATTANRSNATALFKGPFEVTAAVLIVLQSTAKSIKLCYLHSAPGGIFGPLQVTASDSAAPEIVPAALALGPLREELAVAQQAC